ncbi:transcription factor Jun-like, partial [Paramacrobiotus metropolitanus]|uniref:transcription factor Jun-like n=1 Tax=Paramacrobiotus metropolitanus TaxID=2943436 RepID=UPI002445D186
SSPFAAAAPTKAPSGGHKKRNLTLDLKASSTGSAVNSVNPIALNQLTVPATSGATADLKTSPGFLLTSPDVQMLQLASPDLEKFIIQGLMGQSTPTPTTQIVFNPKNVTEDQESYAKGFVDALNALHRNGMAYNVVPANAGNVAFPISQLGQVNGQNVFPQFFTLNPQQQILPIQTGQPQTMTAHPVHHPNGGAITMQMPILQQAKMEPYSPSVSPVPSDPQTVPSDQRSTQSTNSSSGSAHDGPSPAIDMNHQHRMKVERKRERNRLAAAKCRQRKIQRISELEDKVRELKDQNSLLSNTADTLRNDLSILRQELLMHMTSGCSIEMSQNLMQSLQRQSQQQQ